MPVGASSVTGVWLPYFGIELGSNYPAASKSNGRKRDPLKTPLGLVKHGEVYFTKVGFAAFSGTCGIRSYALEVNPSHSLNRA